MFLATKYILMASDNLTVFYRVQLSAPTSLVKLTHSIIVRIYCSKKLISNHFPIHYLFCCDDGEEVLPLINMYDPKFITDETCAF